MDRTKVKQPRSSKTGAGYRRLVIKFGTNLLTAGTRHLDLQRMSDLVEQVARLHQEKREVIIVSSGAIAAGREKLGLDDRSRRDVPFKQTLAAVGQGCLMHTYEQLFGEHEIVVAQALLTKRDLSHRAGYLNGRNTLLSLLDLKVVPIINENDVVATDEIRGDVVFGDNDTLSAMVANLVDADLLMLLSDVAGLYTTDPRVNPKAELVKTVKRIDADIEHMAGGAGSARGTGGMATKIQAARLATSSAVAVVIADGSLPGVITELAQGKSIGTLFLPKTTSLQSRKRWMVSRLASRGKIIVDDGAAAALRQGGGSLLPAGVRNTERDFQRGDLVDIVDLAGNRIACGICNYGSDDIHTIRGAQSDEIVSLLGYEYGAEVVHRNNLAVL